MFTTPKTNIRLTSSQRIAAAAVAALAGLFITPVASAATITPKITEVSLGPMPQHYIEGVAAGSDGNIWFGDGGGQGAIGRVTLAGKITEFSAGLNAWSNPKFDALGPDGSIWFTDVGDTKAIGRITMQGEITEFSAGLNTKTYPGKIAPGPDGNMWFSDEYGAIGRITPSGKITEFSAGLLPGSAPEGIVTGADGNLWFSDDGAKAIGRITPSGKITEFTTGLNSGSLPDGIAAGPDGNLWFADEGTTAAIGRISTAGKTVEFSTGLNPGASPYALTRGPDGNLWFTDRGSTPTIGTITTSGAITEFDPGTSGINEPESITTGADGNVWFGDFGNSSIGRITTPPAAKTTGASASGPTSAEVTGLANGHAQATSVRVQYGPTGGPYALSSSQSLGTITGGKAVRTTLTQLQPKTAYQARLIITNPTGTTAGAFVQFNTPALLTMTGVAQSHKTWRERHPIARTSSLRRLPVGTTFRMELSKRARLSLTFRHRVHGRTVKAGRMSLAGRPGINRFKFAGRVSPTHRLKPGHYTVLIAARDASGQHAGPEQLRFMIAG